MPAIIVNTNGKAKAAQEFGGRRVRNYRRASGRWIWHPALRDGHFTRWDVPAMLQDHAVNLGLYTIFGPLFNAQLEVRANSREIKTFVENTCYRFWHHDLGKVLMQYVPYGSCCGEVLYEVDPESGLWKYAGLDDFDTTDVQALRRGRQLTGARVSYGSMVAGGYMPPNNDSKYGRQGDPNQPRFNELRHPKIFWCAHRAVCGELWGRSALETAWAPWMERVGIHGAVSIRRLWFFANAFRGVVVKYPPGSTLYNGVQVDNRDIAAEVSEAMSTGAATYLPSGADENGNPLWEIVDPKVNDQGKGLLDYPIQLCKDTWQGMGIPDEVIRAPDVGGSWSGRSGPLKIFYDICDMRVREIVTAFDVGPSGYTTRNEQAGGPVRSLVLENFGPKAKYEIRPISLIPKPAEPGAGGSRRSAPGAATSPPGNKPPQMPPEKGPGGSPMGPPPGMGSPPAPAAGPMPVKLSGVELPDDAVKRLLGQVAGGPIAA